MEQQSETIGKGLISEIEKAASTKVEQIIQQAKSEAQKILEDAEKAARQMILVEKEKTERLILGKKQQAESFIKIELRKLQLGLKKEFADMVFEKARQKATSFRNDPEYRRFLKNAILETIEVIDTFNIIIRFSFLDQDYFNSDFEKEIEEICRKDIKKDISIKFVRADFQDIGIIGMSGDGQILYENTFTARMNRLYDEVYTEIMGEEI